MFATLARRCLLEAAVLRKLPILHGRLGLALPMRDSSIPPWCAIQSTNAFPNCDVAERVDLLGMERGYDELNCCSIPNLLQPIAAGTLAGVGLP
jgi:hypothetical protein